MSLEVNVEEDDYGWAVWINNYGGDPEDAFCVGSSDKGLNGARLGAIEDALINLQSGIVLLHEMREAERAAKYPKGLNLE